MALQIITADLSHAAMISSIGKKAFREAFGHLFNNKTELTEYLEYTYDPVKLNRSLRKDGNIYLLAFWNDTAVGFTKVKTFSLNSQIESVSQMELQKIYVLPEYHGLGIGQALMNEILKLSKEINPDYIWLDTPISNAKAICFYEKNGFTKCGKHYFTIGTQVFEYFVMLHPVAVEETCNC
jgi:ribosomal protein S18 acetylase RimI-like enzyme